MLIVPMWIFSTIGSILAGFGDKGTILPVLLISTEIVALTVCILFKINKTPVPTGSKAVDSDKKVRTLYSGVRLLHYAIYANILYSILVLISVILILANYGSDIGYVIMHPVETLINIVVAVLISIMVPFLAVGIIALSIITTVLGTIVITSLSIMFFLVYIMSLNGSIRLLYTSKQIRRKRLLSVVFLILPIINLFCMLRLCGMAKEELKQSAVESGFSVAG